SRQAREVLEEGVRQTGPHPPRFRKLAEQVFELLRQCESGQFTDEQALAMLKASVEGRPPGAPDWLESGAARGILEALREGERQGAGRAQEFAAWISKEFSMPRGRPPSADLEDCRQVLILRQRRWGWMRIAKFLHRNKANHACNQRCADHFRHAAKNFK